MQIMTTMKLSNSYNQNKIKIICDDLCEDIENLFNVLEINEYRISNKMVTMCCPIHGGDNPSAINLYHVGDSYRGNWKCQTHGCETVFKPSIVGFIRGVLSRKKLKWSNPGDKTVSFKESLNFSTSFINKNFDSIKPKLLDIDKKNFNHIVKHINSNITNLESSKIEKHQVRKSLKMPCEYFINRGYTDTILDKYDIGLCDNPSKPMYSRAVVPIYNYDGKYIVGCTGRSIFEKCKNCLSYHNPMDLCPSKSDLWKYPKWKHNNGFKSQDHLYNFWYAKKHIQITKKIILVESPGNVWRLEESGINNSVALFGANLSDRQKLIIDSSGAMDIIILTDNDEAGSRAKQQIIEKCKRIYRIITPDFDAADIADMSIEEIKKQIIPQINIS